MEQFNSQHDSLSTQAMRTLSRRLSAYLPMTLTRQLLQKGMPPLAEPRYLTAATMFADMSGFSQMAEALAVLGPRGAEELNRTLLMTFTALINAIHDSGGAVSHFHGDAMMVYFPDEDGQAAARALAAARFMQSLMLTTLSNVRTARTITSSLADQSQQFDLTIKIGVGYGRCVELVVGELESHCEFVLGGTAVDEAVLAQQQAEAGEVVGSQAVLRAAGFSAYESFRIVTEVVPVPRNEAGIYWEAYEENVLRKLLDIVPAFMPNALFERLLNKNTQFVAEHRTVTSLFLQFEGIDFEAEDAGTLLQDYYLWVWDVVRRFAGKNGRVNRILTGDKGNQFHIIFGAPVAPDAPEQAIRCAMALQAGKPDFIQNQRIGLAAGRAFAVAVGSQNRREYTAVGPIINLSARLTQHCPADAIVVDAVTARRTENEIEFIEHAAIEMKGWAEPVPIFQVVKEKPRPNQLQTKFSQWDTPPVGRKAELEQLQAAMDEALQGRGNVVSIYAPYGGGHLVFLSAGVRHWLAGGGRGFVGSCQQHASDVLFAPWQAIWRDFFNLTPDLTNALRVSRVLSLAREYCPDCGDEAELWREPLGLPNTNERLRPMPSLVQQSRFHALHRQTMVSAAKRQPMLIILEDVQWADQMSLDLLDELTTTVNNNPLLIVITYRQSGYLPIQALTREDTININLEDLSPDDARQYVRRHLGTGDLPVLVEQRLGIRDRQGRTSSVNPLFLEESLKMMLTSGVLRVDEDGYGNGRLQVEESRLTEMQVPDSIYAIMLSRLDQLSASSRNLLQIAAVIGREFDLYTLNSVAPKMEQAEVRSLLNELVEADMLLVVAFEPSSVFMFQHTVLHDVVYQSLPFARRQSLHNQIADLYLTRYADNEQPVYGLLAYHYGQTNQHVAGLDYAMLAAEDARLRFANRSAAEFYRQALSHLLALGIDDHWETAVIVYTARANVLFLMGKFAQAIASANNALQFCQDNNLLSKTWSLFNLLAEIRCAQGKFTEATKNLLPFEKRMPRQVPVIDQIKSLLLRGRTAWGRHDLADALHWLEKAEDLCLSAGDELQLTQILAERARVMSENGELEAAVETAKTAVHRAELIPQSLITSLTVCNLAFTNFRAGNAKEALKYAHKAVDSVRNTSQNHLAHALILRASIYCYQSKFVEARLDFRMSEELLLSMDDDPGLVKLYTCWGVEALGGVGDWVLAEQTLNKANLMLDRGGLLVRERAGFALAQAKIAYELKRFVDAELFLQTVFGLIQKHQIQWIKPEAYYLKGMLKYFVDGDDENGRVAMIDALKAVKEGGCPDEMPLILLRLAQFTADNSDKRWQYYEACVAAAHERSRMQDKRICFAEAGKALSAATDERLRRIGAGCLAWIDSED